MKCWKCGAEIPAGASVCTYCSTSTTRKSPVTAAGRAMRQIYDRFGSGKVFDKKSILPTALGDLLEDSKKLRGYIEMAMSAGIGSIYANQIRGAGKPDSAFYAKVKTLIVEEAGLSDKIAKELMGYFDEMIGWNGTIQPGKTPSDTSNQNMDNYERLSQLLRDASRNPKNPQTGSNKEIPRPDPNKKTPPTPPPNPTPVKPPVTETKIPLPTIPVSELHSCSGCLGELFLMGIAIACGIGGASLLGSGVWHVGIVCLLLAVFFFKCATANDKKITCNRNASGTNFTMSWEGALDKFAIAVGSKWVLTGSGSRATLTGEMFTHCKPGEKIYITLAEITNEGVKHRGQVKVQMPQK